MGRIVQFYKHVEPLFHPSSIWTHTADHGKDYIKSQSWRIYDLAIIRLSSRFKQQKTRPAGTTWEDGLVLQPPHILKHYRDPPDHILTVGWPSDPVSSQCVNSTSSLTSLANPLAGYEQNKDTFEATNSWFCDSQQLNWILREMWTTHPLQSCHNTPFEY